MRFVVVCITTAFLRLLTVRIASIVVIIVIVGVVVVVVTSKAVAVSTVRIVSIAMSS
jgi:hypothetical protein